MNDDIIQKIDAQIALLQEARAILLGTNINRGPRRPKPTTPPKADVTVERPAKRKMSAEVRARISVAQKAPWTKLKKAAK